MRTAGSQGHSQSNSPSCLLLRVIPEPADAWKVRATAGAGLAAPGVGGQPWGRRPHGACAAHAASPSPGFAQSAPSICGSSFRSIFSRSLSGFCATGDKSTRLFYSGPNNAQTFQISLAMHERVLEKKRINRTGAELPLNTARENFKSFPRPAAVPPPTCPGEGSPCLVSSARGAAGGLRVLAPLLSFLCPCSVGRCARRQQPRRSVSREFLRVLQGVRCG